MELKKPASEYTSEERREFMKSLTRSILLSITPNMPNRHSGAQIAYAKGRAWKAMLKAGF